MMGIDAVLGVLSTTVSEDVARAVRRYSQECGSSPAIGEPPSGSPPVAFTSLAPSLYDEPAFLRWALIWLWRPLGPLWLKIFSDGWLRENPPTPIAPKE